MSRRLRAALVGLAVLSGGAACSDGGDAGGDANDLEGAWDVQFVVGLVDADPAADVAFPTDATYIERWVFDECDDVGCTLRRPDGGFLFGDLDAVRVERGDGSSLEGEDAERRFTGEGNGSDPPPVEEEEAGPCDGAATEEWLVRVDLDVRDQVLSGSAFRTPEALTADVNGLTCYGFDLTLGLSGTPAR